MSKEELTKLLMESYDRGVEDAKQAALDALEKTVAVMVAAQLAQQEPVGWWDDKLGFFAEKHFDQLQPIYKSPPQRTWVGLTLQDREALRDQFEDWRYPAILVDAISNMLKEKNT